jgi:hypothetical protein
MSKLLLGICLACALQTQQCEWRNTTAGKVQRQFQQQLQPYFPKAQVRAFPDRGLLLGISCAKNLGPAARETVQAQATKKIQSLPPLSRVVAGIGGLHTVGLGFEQSILVVELGTGKQKWVPAENFGGYAQTYSDFCR